MSIRIRAFLIIILTNLLIIMFSVSAGISFVRNNARKSQETDLMVVADISDHFISSEIEILKLKASMIVHILREAGDEEWPGVLVSQEALYPEFIGMAVLDAELGLITSTGEVPATAEIMDERFIRPVFLGRQAFSSTIPSSSGMVFYLAVPLLGANRRVLVLTLPGMYFSQRVSTFVIYQTGHIFIDDAEGHVIANMRENWVQQRINFIKLAEEDKEYEQIASVIKNVIRGEPGIGYFSLAGVPRLCAYRPVTASREGWCLGVIAPLPESPLRNIDRGLITVGLVGIFLSIIAAVIASNFVKKPFEEVAALKEAAELNSRYKSNFLANMSHEMRTPLNVVVGLTNLRIEDGKLSGEVLNDMTKINNAGELLLGIVNDVLDISKIEAGRLEIIQADYNTASLLNDVITLNMIRIESKPINFIVDINENFPEELFGDELRVKQIFNNLLSNAFKYTKEGTVTLKVDYPLRDGKEIWISIRISDTGVGIRPEDMKRLFSEYNQVDTKANRKIEGTGLGLAITKKLVEMIGGEITVESEYGKGTTFNVSIKQGYRNDLTLGQETVNNLRNFRYTDDKQLTSTKLVRPDLSNTRVLVVDDYPTNLDVAAGMLRKYKIQVDCVGKGQVAVELIKRGEPVYDAVFMDHMMPEMDGIEAIKLIRGMDSEYAKTVPVISLTANALIGNEQMFMEKGFNAFLAKPINIFKLDAIVKKWIRKKQRNNESNLDFKQEETKMSAIEIPGVNMDAGLDLYGGEMDIYVSVLESFAANTMDALDKIRTVSESTLPDYAIVVHGLKSVSSTIAAEDVSQKARKLEMMAKAGDLPGILADNDKFLKDTEKLVNDVKTWLKTSGA